MERHRSPIHLRFHDLLPFNLHWVKLGGIAGQHAGPCLSVHEFETILSKGALTGSKNVWKSSILLESYVLWELLRFIMSVRVQHLIVIDFIEGFTIKIIWSYHIIWAHHTRLLLCYVKFMLLNLYWSFCVQDSSIMSLCLRNSCCWNFIGFLPTRFECYECLQILRRKTHIHRKKSIQREKPEFDHMSSIQNWENAARWANLCCCILCTLMLYENMWASLFRMFCRVE